MSNNISNCQQCTTKATIQDVKSKIHDFFNDFEIIEMIREAHKIIKQVEELPPTQQDQVLAELKKTPVSYFLSKKALYRHTK